MTEREKTFLQKVVEIRNKLRDGGVLNSEEERILDKALEYLHD